MWCQQRFKETLAAEIFFNSLTNDKTIKLRIYYKKQQQKKMGKNSNEVNLLG